MNSSEQDQNMNQLLMLLSGNQRLCDRISPIDDAPIDRNPPLIVRGSLIAMFDDRRVVTVGWFPATALRTSQPEIYGAFPSSKNVIYVGIL